MLNSAHIKFALAVVAALGIVSLLMLLSALLVLNIKLEQPVRVQLNDPLHLEVNVTDFPHPTPLPTPRPTPHGHDPSADPVRIGRHFDTITGLAGTNYQLLTAENNPKPFAFSEFGTAGSASNDGWHLIIPDCQHLAGDNANPPSFPWTRYGIAFPDSISGIEEVIIGGLNQRNGFAMQMVDSPDGTPMPYGFDGDGAGYKLLVSKARLDCRALENTEWTVR